MNPTEIQVSNVVFAATGAANYQGGPNMMAPRPTDRMPLYSTST